MKNRQKWSIFHGVVCFCVQFLLHSAEGHNEEPHFVWYDASDVKIQDRGVFAQTNKGLVELNVVEYDRIHDRYKIRCLCLQGHYSDPIEALITPIIEN